MTFSAPRSTITVASETISEGLKFEAPPPSPICIVQPDLSKSHDYGLLLKFTYSPLLPPSVHHLYTAPMSSPPNQLTETHKINSHSQTAYNSNSQLPYHLKTPTRNNKPRYLA